MYGNGNTERFTLILKPHSAPCYGFYNQGRYSRQTTWMVPHVIKHRGDSELLTWRCNWGNACESDCLYAMVREKSNRIRLPEEDGGSQTQIENF